MAQDSHYRWIPSRGHPPRLILFLGLLFVFFGVLAAELALVNGTEGVVRALELRAVQGNRFLAIMIYSYPVVVAVGIVGILAVDPRRVGIGPAGIRLVTVLTTREVPWSSLGPGPVPPKGEWDFMEDNRPGRSRSRLFWISREQAAAVLSDRRAPIAAFPIEYWTWVGLPLPRQTGAVLLP